MNKISKYISTIVLIIIMISICFIQPAKADNDNDNKRTTRISNRNKFTDKTQFNKDISEFKGGGSPKGLPPDPDDGGDGWPIPVGDGVGVILVGGFLYYLRKRKKNN